LSSTILIRREDKNDWERRTPLTPRDAADLQREHDLRFVVEPSRVRVHSDDEYRRAGVEVGEETSAASLVLGVKEVPVHRLEAGKTYVCFAHVIKGQAQNMPALRRMMELGCSLVDYERIVDEQGRRLVFFGLHAGYAGMIETLWCLGRRLAEQGTPTPFAELRQACEYPSLGHAKEHLAEIGARLSRESLGGLSLPLVFGFSGYGNVSRGAQEVFDCLPAVEVPVSELPAVARGAGSGSPLLVKVVFREEHLVRPAEAGASFELQDYYDKPERYRGCFEEHLPHLDVLVNCMYWDERYPRLITREWAKGAFAGGGRPRLRVVGDIGCDVEGCVELTVKATEPEAPCFVVDPLTGAVADGCAGPGLAIMAVDALPTELPLESSAHFSTSLKEMVVALAGADWRGDGGPPALPPHLSEALIVYRGELTPPYRHLAQYLEAPPGTP